MAEKLNMLSFLPSKLRSQLLPFQREGVKYAIEKDGRCLVADEMGLGKTLQALAIAYNYKDEWPLLIIVPASLRYPWIEEIEKWFPEILPNDINLIQSGSDVSAIPTAQISVCSYGLLNRPTSAVLREALSKQEFGVVILDESHTIKNAKAVSTKVVVPLVQQAERRILLTGTPALARPRELFPQLDALNPKDWGSWSMFAKRYCDAHWVYFGRNKQWNTDGASNLAELQQRLTSTVMIRRLKKDVLTQLPPKQRQRIVFHLKDSEFKKEMEKVWVELNGLLRGSDSTVSSFLTAGSGERPSDSYFEIRKRIGELYRLTCKVKIGPVQDYIKLLLENEGLKFLVFGYHHDMMDAIQQVLWDAKVKAIRIDGTVPTADRARLVHEFQNDKAIRVAILSMKAAGVGLTLTAASVVVFAELSWTPGELQQCEDRAHRIGQAAAVNVHYLVAKETLDDMVWSALVRKTCIVSTTLNGCTQHLRMADGNKAQVRCLSNAEPWQPVDTSQYQDIGSFFQSTQANGQRSVLDFFKPKSRKKSGPKTPSMSKTIQEEDSTSSPAKTLSAKAKVTVKNSENKSKTCKNVIVLDSGSDNEDFRSTERKRKHLNDLEVVGNDEDEEEDNAECKRRKLVHRKDEKSFKKNGRKTRKCLISKDNALSGDEMDGHLETAACDHVPGSPVASTSTVYTPERLSCTIGHQPNMGTPDVVPPTSAGTADRVSSISEQHPSMVPPTSRQLPGDNTAERSAPLTASCDSTPVCPGTGSSLVPAVGVQVASKWSCPVCTFLNHVVLPYCEMCNSPKPKDWNTRSKKKKKNSAIKTTAKTTKMLKGFPSTPAEISVQDESVSQNDSKHQTTNDLIDENSSSDGEFVDLQVSKLNALPDWDANSLQYSESKDGCSYQINASQNADFNESQDSELDKSYSNESIDVQESGTPSNILSSGKNISASKGSPETVLVAGEESEGEEGQDKDDSMWPPPCPSELPVSQEEAGNNTRISDSQSSFSNPCTPDGKRPLSNTLSPYTESVSLKKHMNKTFTFRRLYRSPLVSCQERSLALDEVGSPGDTCSSLCGNSPLWRASERQPSNPTESRRRASSITHEPMGINPKLHAKASRVHDISSSDEDEDNLSIRTTPARSTVENAKPFILRNVGRSILTDSTGGRWTCIECGYDSNPLGATGCEGCLKTKPNTLNNQDSSSSWECQECGLKNYSNNGTECKGCLETIPIILNDQDCPTFWNCEECGLKNNGSNRTQCEGCLQTKPNRLKDQHSLIPWDCQECGLKNSDSNGTRCEGCQHIKPNRVEDQDRSTSWYCRECGLKNSDEDEVQCAGCLADKPPIVSAAAAVLAEGEGEGEGQRVVNLDEIAVYTMFHYCCSKHTSRIHLYDQAKQPLNTNFVPLDVELGNISNLPDILIHPGNLKLIQRFSREWKSLAAAKQRRIIKSGTVFSNPVLLYEDLLKGRTLTSQRYVSHHDKSAVAHQKAMDIGGSVRMLDRSMLQWVDPLKDKRKGKYKHTQKRLSEPSGTGDRKGNELKRSGSEEGAGSTQADSERYRGIAQVVTKDGTPLCVECSKPYSSPLVSQETLGANAWATRFCTTRCADQYWVKSHRTYGRDQVFESEHGICQMCDLDAQDFYNRLKKTKDLKKRAEFIKNSTYDSLKPETKNKMVSKPYVGLFWHADHIRPVYEGGGQCDIDNLRTLCTVCHQKVTAQQNRDRVNKRRLQDAVGSRDITAFFKTTTK